LKKIALASAAMGGAALLAFGASGTFAAFQDTASLTNEAGAGTLVLDARNPSVTAPVDALSLKPGEKARFAYYVQNDGDLAGTVDADFLNVVNNENECVGPETDPGVDADCGATEGEFTTAATVAGYLIPNVTGASQCTIAAADGRTANSTMTFAQADAFNALKNVPVAAGQATCVVLEVALGNAGNDVQSDSASFDVRLTLKQA
jgi:predicted ribosomally synthesized peptide with SipW-like signal peptide